LAGKAATLPPSTERSVCATLFNVPLLRKPQSVDELFGVAFWAVVFVLLFITIAAIYFIERNSPAPASQPATLPLAHGRPTFDQVGDGAGEIGRECTGLCSASDRLMRFLVENREMC
jgi:hypothetical protein